MTSKPITESQLLDYFIHHATMSDTGSSKRPFFVHCKVDNMEFMAEADSPWKAYEQLVTSVFGATLFLKIHLMKVLTKAYYTSLTH